MPFSYGEPNVTTAAEVSRNFGRWQDEAINGPVVVTHHGRIRVVLISAAQYARWNSGAPKAETSKAQEDVEGARLSSLLAYTRDGFIAVDRHLVVTDVNRAAEDYHGRPRDKLVGAPLLETFPGLEGSPILERVRRVVVSGRADRIETRSTIYPERFVRLELFPYAGGVGMLFENLTETREMQARAERLDAVTTSIAASPSMASMTINLRGSIETISDRMVEWLGLRASDVVGLRVQDLLAVEDRAVGRKAVEQVFREHEPQTFNVTLLSNGGADIPVRCEAAPIRSNGLLSELYVLVTRR